MTQWIIQYLEYSIIYFIVYLLVHQGPFTTLQVCLLIQLIYLFILYTYLIRTLNHSIVYHIIHLRTLTILNTYPDGPMDPPSFRIQLGMFRTFHPSHLRRWFLMDPRDFFPYPDFRTISRWLASGGAFLGADHPLLSGLAAVF